MSFSPFDDAHPRYTPTSMFGQTQKHQLDKVGAMIKRTKGLLLGWVLHNSGYGTQQIDFYDQAFYDHTNPPGHHDILDWSLVLAPGELATAEFAMGIPFYYGIAYTQAGFITGVLLYA